MLDAFEPDDRMICTTCGARYPKDTQFCPADGTTVVPISTSVQGDEVDLTGERIFGDYMIRRRLGTGGMGAVYLAENLSIDQKIAIKVLHPAGEQSEEMFKRFNLEAQTISRLTHPNIIRVFIFGKTESGLLYLAMEYVKGHTLRNAIEDHEPISELRAISIMRQSLHALSEAHDLGIIHRDLKPDNIMLTKFRGVDDYIKILDFGIAKVKQPNQTNDSKLTQAGVVYGTPEYLSPEQARARDLTPAADVYSMGIILYEMMTGCVPFTGSSSMSVLAAHVYEQPPKPSEVGNRSISPEMERIILKAIEKKPSKRYKSAMAMLEDLETREAELKGGAAVRTTVLAPSEVSVVYNASRQSQGDQLAETQRSAQVPDPANTAAPAPASWSAPQQQQPAPASAGGVNPRVLGGVIALLVVLIVGLIVLLLTQ